MLIYLLQIGFTFPSVCVFQNWGIWQFQIQMLVILYRIQKTDGLQRFTKRYIVKKDKHAKCVFKIKNQLKKAVIPFISQKRHLKQKLHILTTATMHRLISKEENLGYIVHSNQLTKLRLAHDPNHPPTLVIYTRLSATLSTNWNEKGHFGTIY